VSVEAAIIGGADMPVYLRIADKAKHLRELGMSDRAIARTLEVSDKTVVKAAGRAKLSPRACPNLRQSCD
jgi:orotate phosphoribosyltransferase-like protein